MTLATKAVLRVLLDGGELYGREIGNLADLPSGTVMPILLRLVQEGWLESRREDIDPRAAGRPVRSYYRLTEQGTKSARDALGGK